MRCALTLAAALALGGCVSGASVNVQAGNGPCSALFTGAEVVVTSLAFACRGGQLPSASADSVVAAPTEGIAVPQAGGVTRPGAVRVIPPPRR